MPAAIARSICAQRCARGGGSVADGPWTARRVRRRDSRIVRPFAEGAADGMNRRQVHNVEAHRGNLGQLLLHIAEGSVLTGNRRGRTRKQLVPRRESRPLAIDPQRQLGFKLRGIASDRDSAPSARQFFIARIFVERALLAGQAFKLAQSRSSVGVIAFAPLRPLHDQDGSRCEARAQYPAAMELEPTLSPRWRRALPPEPSSASSGLVCAARRFSRSLAQVAK